MEDYALHSPSKGLGEFLEKKKKIIEDGSEERGDG